MAQSPLFYDAVPYRIVNDGDALARSIIERHYSRIWRGKPGAPRFIGPGRKLVLVGVNGGWVFLWRESKFRRDGQTGAECTAFRNESAILSSEIIGWAEEAWDKTYGTARKYTYVNPRLIRSTNPGFCFIKAGWKRVPKATFRKLILLVKDDCISLGGAFKVIVMPSNNTCWLVHYWAGLYGNLAHLLGPARVEKPYPHLPYALDNGAFGAWANNRPWDREAFITHVERYAFLQLRPQWVVVPDVVADRELTLARWAHWAPILANDYHLPLAIAVQDGMTPEDVETLAPKADIVFVGGSTEWKWSTYKDWARKFPRVHVGRVNTESQLERCAEAGVESCDGTGWFREISRVVFHSRLKNAGQLGLPLEVPA